MQKRAAILLERGEIVLHNGIDITVDLEVLCFWGDKIRAIVLTKAMYEITWVYVS